MIIFSDIPTMHTVVKKTICLCTHLIAKTTLLEFVIFSDKRVKRFRIVYWPNVTPLTGIKWIVFYEVQQLNSTEKGSSYICAVTNWTGTGLLGEAVTGEVCNSVIYVFFTTIDNVDHSRLRPKRLGQGN